DMLSYAVDEVEIESLALFLDSNVTGIKLQGSYEDRELEITSLDIKRVDLPTLQRYISGFKETDQRTKAADKEDSQPFYLPKYIRLDHLYLNAKPTIFDPLQLQKFNLQGSDIVVDLEERLVEDGSMLLDARSNLSNMIYKGRVDENRLMGKVAFTPHKRLFELSGLPLRKEAFGDIEIDLLATKSYVQAGVEASVTQILTGRKGEFNIDIDSFVSNVIYHIEEEKLTSDTKMMISTPYAKNISLSNQLTMDKKLAYHGEIYAKEVYGLEENLTGVLKDLNVTYQGDDKHLDATLASDTLEGSFVMQNYKTGSVALKTNREIQVKNITKLPEA
ncbi:MAG: hypothetical protein ACP5D3_08305, partial [Sulfurovum sp.]